MRVKSLSLKNFRNYEQASITPDSGVTVFTGPNAQGKTNILEALHLCCLGRSHRTARDEELIRWGADSARVQILTQQLDGRKWALLACLSALSLWLLTAQSYNPFIYFIF